MQAVNTIDDLLCELNEIVKICSRKNLRAEYFAVLNRLVTRKTNPGLRSGILKAMTGWNAWLINITGNWFKIF